MSKTNRKRNTIKKDGLTKEDTQEGGKKIEKLS